MTGGGNEDVIGAWVKAGMIAGLAIGGAYGTCIIPLFGTIVGAFTGLLAGFVAGFIIGPLLYCIDPSPPDAPLLAEAATELILLPLQIWLWTVIHSTAFFPLVIAPSVVSVAVAALLARRLPPGAGSRGGGQPPHNHQQQESHP
jgi:hypothetical protein